jgi:transposase
MPFLCHSDAWRAMMNKHDGKTYRPWEPQRSQQEAHSPAAKLPAGDLVFFLLDTVPRLDVRRCYAPYATETRGAPPFDPAMMVGLLLEAYCVGVFASRKLALAGERNLAFLALVGTERPDFRTLRDFRQQHLEAFKDVFVQVVRLAGAAGLVQLGNVATDGTPIQGNASRHKARRYGYMQKAVERLREEREAVVTAAYQQDEAEEAALGSRRGDELPAELARREERVARIEAAMRRLEAQAKAAADAERQCRAAAEAERQRTGKTRRGPAPKPVEEPPDDKAQSNCTDPDRHIMRTNNKGWESCGNAQASVDGACQIIGAWDVTEASNDQQQAEPIAQATLAPLAQAGLERPTDESGTPQAIPATLDNGYDSEAAVEARET